MDVLIHVTYRYLERNYRKLLEKGVNLEVLFFSTDIDSSVDRVLLKDITSMFEEAGLFFNVHAPFYDLNLGSFDGFILDAVIRRYESLLPVVEIMKPRALVIHTGYDRWRYRTKEGDWLDIAVNTLTKLDSLFPKDMKLLLENVFDEAPNVLYDLLTNFDSSRFGCCFDVGHFHLFSKAEIDEWLIRIGDRIFELHIHDNDKLDDRHWAIGRGSAPVYRLLRWAILEDVPYFTIEAHTELDALLSLERLLDLKKRVLEGSNGL